MKKPKKRTVFKKRAVGIDLAGPPRWVDYFEMTWSSEKFSVALAMEGLKGEKTQAHTLIVLSPRTARILQEVLANALTAYEKKNGPIDAREIKVDL